MILTETVNALLIGGHAHAWKVLLAGEDEKRMNFLGCVHAFDLVFKSCSDINERNRLQLLFYFLLLMSIYASIIGTNIFSSVFQFLEWSFLKLLFFGNVCKLMQELIGSELDCFWGFFLEDGFFHWLYICMVWNLHELLKLVFFKKSSLFDNSFGGYFGLIFKCAGTFQQWDFVISIDKL